MTIEKFKRELESKGISYKDGPQGFLIVYYKEGIKDAYLNNIKTMPPKIIFDRTIWHVELGSLRVIPPGVFFNNSGDVLLSLAEKNESIVGFYNGGWVLFGHLTELNDGADFRNGGSVDIETIKRINPGVKINNKSDFSARSHSWNLDTRIWKCVIDNIGEKRLLNLMIDKGLFL